MDSRSAAGFDARVIAVDRVATSYPVRGVLENVGGGGIALLSERGFAKRGHLTVAFKLPGDEQPSEVVVEVVATEKLVTRESVSHCRFVTISPEALRAVNEWTEARGSI